LNVSRILCTDFALKTVAIERSVYNVHSKEKTSDSHVYQWQVEKW
jgi:hypothetical protein